MSVNFIRDLIPSILALAVSWLIVVPAIADQLPEASQDNALTGTWWAADPDKVSGDVNEFLQEAQLDLQKRAPNVVPNGQPVLAIVVPCANDRASAQAAAYSYQIARRSAAKRVFVLAPSTDTTLNGIVMPGSHALKTPVGNLTIDDQVLEELSSYPLFEIRSHTDAVDRALRLQLPYIRQALGDVKIVPLIVGGFSLIPDMHFAAEVLKGYVKPGDLIVTCWNFADQNAFVPLAKLDVEGFLKSRQDNATASASNPCVLLSIMLPAAARGELLNYAPGGSASAPEKPADYLAAAFVGPAWPSNDSPHMNVVEVVRLTEEDKKELLRIARYSVEQFVRTGKKVNAGDIPDLKMSPGLRTCSGAFVSLYKRQAKGVSSHAVMRGCRGHSWATRPVYQQVCFYAARAAEDQRFARVDKDELSDLRIEISVLTPPRRVRAYNEIRLGTDGIVLVKAHQTATFLPYVPFESKWDLAETLRQLALKTGLKGNDWRDGCKFDVFETVTFAD